MRWSGSIQSIRADRTLKKEDEHGAIVWGDRIVWGGLSLEKKIRVGRYMFSQLRFWEQIRVGEGEGDGEEGEEEEDI